MTNAGKLLREAKQLASDKSVSDVTAPPKLPKRAAIPITVHVDSEMGHLKEHFLWKLGGNLTSTQAAQKLVNECGLPLNFEKLVELQIDAGVKPWGQAKVGQSCIRTMQIRAIVKDLVFEDKLEWDLAHPLNTAERYASGVCRDLGLSYDMQKAIAAAATKKIAEFVQTVTPQAKSEEEEEPPAKKLKRDPLEADSWGPRIRPYNPELDKEVTLSIVKPEPSVSTRTPPDPSKGGEVPAGEREGLIHHGVLNPGVEVRAKAEMVKRKEGVKAEGLGERNGGASGGQLKPEELPCGGGPEERKQRVGKAERDERT